MPNLRHISTEHVASRSQMNPAYLKTRRSLRSDELRGGPHWGDIQHRRPVRATGTAVSKLGPRRIGARITQRVTQRTNEQL